jgi:hypothetical protein
MRPRRRPRGTNDGPFDAVRRVGEVESRALAAAATTPRAKASALGAFLVSARDALAILSFLGVAAS